MSEYCEHLVHVPGCDAYICICCTQSYAHSVHILVPILVSSSNLCECVSGYFLMLCSMWYCDKGRGGATTTDCCSNCPITSTDQVSHSSFQPRSSRAPCPCACSSPLSLLPNPPPTPPPALCACMFYLYDVCVFRGSGYLEMMS